MVPAQIKLRLTGGRGCSERATSSYNAGAGCRTAVHHFAPPPVKPGRFFVIKIKRKAVN